MQLCSNKKVSKTINFQKVKEDGTTEPVTNAIDAGKYKVTVSVNSGFPTKFSRWFQLLAKLAHRL